MFFIPNGEQALIKALKLNTSISTDNFNFKY